VPIVKEIVLQLWDVKEAPESLRRLVPPAHANGWLALVPPGGSDGFLEGLVSHWSSLGFPVRLFKNEDGATVLVGSHSHRSVV